MTEKSMRHRKQTAGLLLVGAFLCAGFGAVRAADQILVKVTTNGLESLTYAGVEYCDPSGCGVLGFDDRLKNPTWERVQEGPGLKFDPASGEGYAEIANSPSVEKLQEGNYTLTAWFKPLAEPAGTGWANDASYGIVVKAGYHLGLSYSHGKRFVMTHWLKGEKGASAESGGMFDPGKFYHLAGVVDRSAGTVKLYVDGHLEGQASFPVNAAARPYGATPWRLGIAKPGAEGYRWSAHGIIGEVSMLKTALAAEQVKMLAQNAVARKSPATPPTPPLDRSQFVAHWRVDEGAGFKLSDCSGGRNDGALLAGGNLWAPCVVDTNKSRDAFRTVPITAAMQGDTVTKTYAWGALAASYIVQGADLYVTATITNTSTTPIGWWKANLLQLNSRLVFDSKATMPYGYTPNMHWDYRWAMWGGSSDGYETWNFADPHVYWWIDRALPFEKAPVKVMFADLDPKWQTGVYHVKTDHGDAWPVVGSADGDPGGALLVASGQSDTAHVVIRFRAKQQMAGVGATMPSAIEVCADGYEAYGRAYPRTARWTDRRPIGTYFGCRGTAMHGTNPNGWFNDSKIDTTTPQGREAFAVRLLADIDATIATLTNVGAQGVLWWDVEGARWPQPTTYIGDPRVLDPAHPQHDKYAPELDTPVTYNGQQMKVVDVCFRKWQDAGFRSGVTIRPQTLVWKDAPQQTGEDIAQTDNLCAKATYARERWGCTIFYIDSISEWFGNLSMAKTVSKYPDILLIPEWARTRTYRYSSQFSYTKFSGLYRGVPAEMQACWPDAFCCMGNVDYEKNYDDALYAVQRGNVQMFNCWCSSTEARKIKQIYQSTGIKHTPVVEDQALAAQPEQALQVKLTATDEDGDAVAFSIMAPPEHGTLSRFEAKAGTVTYTPARRYTGPDFFTYKATDATGLNSNRGRVGIVVKKR